MKKLFAFLTCLLTLVLCGCGEDYGTTAIHKYNLDVEKSNIIVNELHYGLGGMNLDGIRVCEIIFNGAEPQCVYEWYQLPMLPMDEDYIVKALDLIKDKPNVSAEVISFLKSANGRYNLVSVKESEKRRTFSVMLYDLERKKGIIVDIRQLSNAVPSSDRLFPLGGIKTGWEADRETLINMLGDPDEIIKNDETINLVFEGKYDTAAGPAHKVEFVLRSDGTISGIETTLDSYDVEVAEKTLKTKYSSGYPFISWNMSSEIKETEDGLSVSYYKR